MAQVRDAKGRTPEQARRRARNYNLRKHYDIDQEEYEWMLAQQGGVCAICGTDQPRGQWDVFHVDHNHATNKVRGLLCMPCNQGLGHFYDSPESLDAAANYLREHA